MILSFCHVASDLSCVMRKPVFGISNKVRHKLGCTAMFTEDGLEVKISNSESRGIVLIINEAINKGADQLAARLPLFSHMQKEGFLMKQLICLRCP